MQISGRIVILGVLTVALAMSGGAWWYQYQASRRSAEFWGRDAARLLVSSERVELLDLGPLNQQENGETVAGCTVVAVHDLSDQRGLVHLRHAFTQDADFQWEQRRPSLPNASGPWAHALRFTRGDESLVLLLRQDFAELGKVIRSPDGEVAVDVLPCPRLAAPVRQYLIDVGALDGER